MAQSAEVISHWHLLVDDLSTSALEFYASVAQGLTDRKVPDIKVTQVEWREAGLLSARRVYLRVARERTTFDLCAAPYGTSYFFSWWFAEVPPEHVMLFMYLTLAGLPILFFSLIIKIGFFGGIFSGLFICGALLFLINNSGTDGRSTAEEVVLAMPIFGPWYRRFFKPTTYYATDTHIMFQESVHRAVLDAVEGVRAIHGLQALSPAQAQPTMRDILR